MIKKNIFHLILTVFFSLLFGLLIYKQIIYPTIIPMVINGGASLFADWTVILNANDCLQKGYDVFLENPCDHWNRKHVYGNLLLNIPFIKIFPKFYYFYFPILVNILFIYTITYCLFNLDEKRTFPFLLILIFSIPVLLGIERSNNDLLIFIFMFLICKFRNLFLDYVLIVISSISKFYPILLSLKFLFGSNNKKIFLNFFVIVSLFVIFFVVEFEDLNKIFQNTKQFTGYGFGLYEFSLSGFVKFMSLLNINFYGTDFNWIKYVYIFFFILLPIILFLYLNNSKINQIFISSDFSLTDNFENKIYFLSSSVLLFCYITFSNFIYREIFFIGLIPAILLYRRSINNNILNFFFILLVIKFFITTIFVYFYQNNIFLALNPFMIILKHTLDFLLIALILRLYLNIILFFLRKISI